MYWLIDGICFRLGITYFALSFIYQFPYACWVGLVWIVLYPFLLEAIINMIGKMSNKVEYEVQTRSRIVYNSNYNITFCGIEKCHPFDSQKYGNIYRLLTQRGLIREGEVIVPSLAPRGLLL